MREKNHIVSKQINVGRGGGEVRIRVQVHMSFISRSCYLFSCFIYLFIYLFVFTGWMKMNKLSDSPTTIMCVTPSC